MLEFFYQGKFECGKNLRVSLFPYPKEAPECPLYGAERKIFSGLLHLGHTFRTYIQNYIQKLHFNPHQNYIRITLELRQNYFPRHPLPASMPIIIPFRNYISNTHQTSIGLAPFTYLSTRPFARSLTYLPHPCLHPHSQAFYHIIITFRTYIKITFIFHRVTYFVLTFLFTL